MSNFQEGQLNVTPVEGQEKPVADNVSRQQMTTDDGNEIADKVKADQEADHTPIENDQPTGRKSVKRPLSDKQRAALDSGRQKRHKGKPDKVDKPEESADLTGDHTKSVEKETDTFTARSEDMTKKVLDRLEAIERLQLKEKEKRKKQKERERLREDLKAQIKKSLYKHGQGALNDPKILKDTKEKESYKNDNDVPAATPNRVEKPAYTDNRRSFDHHGLVSRCFGSR